MQSIALRAALAIVAVAGTHPAVAQTAERTAGLDAPQWQVFSNTEGTTVDYPAGIFAAAGAPVPRGDGRELRSSDERARFMVYVENNAEHYSPARFLRTQIRTSRSQLDYQRVTDRFFAVSGISGEQIFYSRCN